MNKLLQFIINFLSALFDEYGFSIVSSNNSGNDFSGASILMTSSEIEIFLAVERNEITVQFRSLFDRRKSNWYSSEIVLALVGHKSGIGVIDERNGYSLKKLLPAIIDRFQKSDIEQTLKSLDELEKEIAKRK